MTVFIVEDSPQTRRQINAAVSAADGLRVVGEVGSMRDALIGIRVTRPNAVILDISLPDGSGIEVLKLIRQQHLDVCVIVLTFVPSEELRAKCMELGAAAFFDKLHGFENITQWLLEKCQERLRDSGDANS